MSGNEATIPQDPAIAEGAAEDKGKGKNPAEQAPQDTAMEEDDEDEDSSSDEEEEEVSGFPNHHPTALHSSANVNFRTPKEVPSPIAL